VKNNRGITLSICCELWTYVRESLRDARARNRGEPAKLGGVYGKAGIVYARIVLQSLGLHT
jgi:hypothetical protein